MYLWTKVFYDVKKTVMEDFSMGKLIKVTEILGAQIKRGIEEGEISLIQEKCVKTVIDHLDTGCSDTIP